jgi:hypothetical protein
MLLSCYLQLSQYVKELSCFATFAARRTDDVLIANQQASLSQHHFLGLTLNARRLTLLK